MVSVGPAVNVLLTYRFSAVDYVSELMKQVHWVNLFH